MSEKLDRAAETPYQKACKQSCYWCKDGVPRPYVGHRHLDQNGLLSDRSPYCTAPSRDQFETAQAAEIEDARARVEMKQHAINRLVHRIQARDAALASQEAEIEALTMEWRDEKILSDSKSETIAQQAAEIAELKLLVTQDDYEALRALRYDAIEQGKEIERLQQTDSDRQDACYNSGFDDGVASQAEEIERLKTCRGKHQRLLDRQAAEITRLEKALSAAEAHEHALEHVRIMLTAQIQTLREALCRAERKLSAYVGVCKDDKELTGTVLPMISAAIAQVSEPAQG